MMGVCTVCGQSFPRLRTATHCSNCVLRGGTSSAPSESVVSANITALNDTTPVDGDKLVNELNVTELVALINRTIQPVASSLAEIKNDLEKKTKSYDNKITLLEADSKKKQERIDLLESTIVEMQKFINKIDHDDRKANIIVTGLSENTVDPLPNEEDDVTPLTNDTDKVKALIASIAQGEHFDVSSWEISRIGRPKEGSNRAVKIVTPSSDVREKVLSIASRLKSRPKWTKVFIKKDLHPVYAKENQRIRKKRYELETHFSSNNEEKEVKIVKGALQVDGVTVDRNLFFR